MSRNVKRVLAAAVCVWALAEAAVRIFPSAFERYLVPWGTWQDGCFDPELGNTGCPSQKGFFRREGCLRIDGAVSNPLGFFGRVPLPDDPQPRIGVLGDSFVGAPFVEERALAPSILERWWKVPVVNTAIAGTGTLQQQLVYRRVLKSWKPALVLLFFYFENDVLDNHCDLRIYSGGGSCRPCGFLKDGTLEIRPDFPVPAVPRAPVIGALRKVSAGCRSCRVAFKIVRPAVENVWLGLISNPGLSRYLEVFDPRGSRQWDEAWAVTEQLLVSLDREVRSDGGTLVVVSVPSSISFLPEREYRKFNAGAHPLSDPGYPGRRLQGILVRNSIPAVDLEKEFLAYKERIGLPVPYFSYRCDRHWSPLGHALAAAAITKHVLEKKWVQLDPLRERQALRASEALLRMPPEDILGASAWQRIRRGKLYTGDSQAGDIGADLGE